MQPGTSSAPSSDTIINLDGLGEEHSTKSKLLVLHSLLPVAKLLQGLTQEKNSGCYYVQGEIQPSDLQSLYNYTKCIGQLTLDSDSSLLNVLARIGQLQDSNKPLFPSLHRLCIVHPSLSLIFLHLLLSPALTTLELTAIPVADPCFASVLSFLKCAVDQALNLSSLILGPGQIPGQILDETLRCENLLCLKLIDVGIPITLQLLHDIGSLQYLETFILQDNGTSTYNGSLASPLGFGFLPNSDADRKEVDAALFPTLKTLGVDGPFDLIEDLVAKVSSTDLSAISIDVTKPLERMRRSNIAWSQSPKRLSTTNIMTFLTSSIQKWQESLVSVILTNKSTEILSFPSDVFEDLLLHPDMKHFEISGMDITFMDHIVLRLKEVANSNLEMLLLPVHRTSPSISLAELRHIAEACPHLHSIRCPFTDLSNVKASLNTLSHRLEVLSVNKGHVIHDFSVLREIAHYLDSIFPNLKSIKTDGGVEECQHWRSVFELVKLCQAVRMEERRRLRETKSKSKKSSPSKEPGMGTSW